MGTYIGFRWSQTTIGRNLVACPKCKKWWCQQDALFLNFVRTVIWYVRISYNLLIFIELLITHYDDDDDVDADNSITAPTPK